MRKIRVFSTKTNTSSSFDSSASNWGELRNQIISSTQLLREDMVATVFETKNTLIREDAAIPEGDFTLVLTPAKTKSGQDDIAEIMVRLRDKMNAAFDEIIEEIENGDFSNEEKSTITSELRNFTLD